MISKTTSKHTTPAAIGELEPADRTANGSASITAKRQNQADGDGTPLLEASGTLSGHRRAGPQVFTAHHQTLRCRRRC